MSDKIRILYIDDYELDRELVKDALEKEHGGFQVTEASDKHEFEALLKTREFDVVLSDFNIAGFEGLQVLEAVRSHDPRIPVIIVTGTGSEEIAVMALKRGAADYVIKRPKHILRLPQTILAAIDKQSLKDQRQKAELSLRESEKRYRSLFEKMMNGYAYCRMLFDRNKPSDFIYIDVNKAFETLTGLKNVVGKKVSEVIPGIQENDPELFEICGRVARTGIPETFEIYIQALSMWFSISVYRPEKEHFVAVFDVITERKRAEEMLRKSEERFKAIATNTPDHVLIQDKDLRYVWVLNPQLGLTEKDMIGKTDFDFLPKEDAAFLTQIKKKVLGTGHPEFVKLPLVSLKGDIQYFEGAYIPKRDQEGKIDGLIGYFRNVTDREKSQAALKESEERYKKILENALVGIYQVTLEGKLIFTNQKMIEMFGYSSYEELEAMGGLANLYARPEERPKIVDEIIRKGFIICEIEFNRKDGQSIWAKIHTRKTKNKEGAIILEGLVEDITEIRKMETQLQQSQKLEAIGTLAGGIAHDFNNILSSVIGFAELSLCDIQQGTLLHDNISEVLMAGNRAKELVKQIMTFSRKGEQEKKPIQINPMVKETIRLLRSTIPANIQIKEHIGKEMITIDANPSQMNQVLVNLVTNASHAIDENGIIAIGLESVSFDESIKNQYPDLLPGRYAKIFVSDNGCGIEEENLNLIFDPYFTTKAPDRGTGLGLSVVHGIVKIHNGHITVYSEVGKGTTFNVYLPLAKQSFSDESTLKSEPLPGGTEHILFVDDELSIVKMQKQHLERMGYTVTAMTDSTNVLETFGSAPASFDLVITDMTMPNMTGDRLALAVKNIRPDIPVILCTGFSEKINSEKATDLTIDGFLMKPLNKEKLAKLVRKILDEAKTSSQG